MTSPFSPHRHVERQAELEVMEAWFNSACPVVSRSPLKSNAIMSAESFDYVE